MPWDDDQPLSCDSHGSVWEIQHPPRPCQVAQWCCMAATQSGGSGIVQVKGQPDHQTGVPVMVKQWRSAHRL